MLTFRKTYFLLTLLFFVVEVLIALYVHDAFVRPYVGDYLVVMLLYCFLRSFLRIGVIPAAIAVLLFSYLLEGLQYLGLVAMLGLEQNKLARTVIGYGFDWMDLLAYTLGILTIIPAEKFLVSRQAK